MNEGNARFNHSSRFSTHDTKITAKMFESFLHATDSGAARSAVRYSTWQREYEALPWKMIPKSSINLYAMHALQSRSVARSAIAKRRQSLAIENCDSECERLTMH